MNNNKEKKHLNYEDRLDIEKGLSNGKNYKIIAKELGKDRRTVIREIEKHKIKKIPSSFNNSSNLCKNKMKCKKFDCTKETKECYEEEICNKLQKTPYVCNGCEEKRTCRKIKYYYYAKMPDQEYNDKLRASREGINLSKSEVYEIDKLISPLLIEKGQTVSHIYGSFPDELDFSRTTFYRYINLGIFTAKNINLPRKVKYKKRNESSKQRARKETAIRKGRTYSDFNEYIEKHPDIDIVEMDTVEGIKGGKVLLTLLFRKSKFMIIRIMENKTVECVEKNFKYIKNTLGIEEYKELFKVILTDNGSEFSNPIGLEIDSTTSEKISQVFFCDPSASWQKGAIEKNHEYIRYILPKGTSFDNLNQDKINIIASHINSTCRDSLNNKTPYDAMQFLTNEENIKKLGIKFIPAKEVNLSTNLIK